jgi:sigma-B regulation protein RsbU (phosphoserine phosphatase)
MSLPFGIMMFGSQQRSVISLSGAPEVMATLRRLRDSIIANWPDPNTPDIEIRPAAAALSRFEFLPSGGAWDDSLAIIMCADPHAAEMQSLISSIEARGLPLVLCTENNSTLNRFSETAICLSPSTPPTQVAAICWALCERQRSVKTMAAEIALAHRCEAGIRAEMERMHEELNGAAAIQREFTAAPLPTVDGLHFGLLFRPMNFVSGDVCNVHRIDRHHVSFLIADVVGHGIPAAMLTMVLSNSLAVIERAACATGSPSPSSILKHLNARLRETQPTSSKFATALYGIIDERTREIRVCSAGHPAPVLADRESCRALETGGPLLGVFDDAEFDECAIALNDNETLYLYTDGLDAAIRTHENLQGRTPGARVLSLLTSIHRSPDRCGSSCTDAIRESLDSHMGSLHQEDDLTVLAIGAIPRCDSIRQAA